ncbi:MAG TPA: AraC family transcriptional regulator [Longimicrobium sp.]|jgi:AraC-like DNA-binding protein
MPTAHCRASTSAARLKAVELTVAAMRERLGEPLSLQALARTAHCSQYHFNRLFRQVTGVPPCRFLAAMRLEAAKRLLLTTHHSVTRVCFEVGYNSVGSFTRHFTGDVGLPPHSLRRFATGGAAPPVPDAAPEAGARAVVTASVEAPEGFAGAVFAGVFPEPIPRGRPVVCAVLTGAGELRLGPVPDGDWYVLAAGLDGPPTAATLLHHDALRATAPVSVRGGRAECVRLELRAPSPVDPPILVPLPVLMAGYGSEQRGRSTACGAGPDCDAS